MQLKHPLREDGPVQQFGHDAVFGAEDGIDGLLGDPRFLSDGFTVVLAYPRSRKRRCVASRMLVRVWFAWRSRMGEEYLRAVCFSILTVILSGSIALERIKLTLFNLFLSNYGKQPAGNASRLYFLWARDD